MTLDKILDAFAPSVTAEAHCDIPCGIYDPTPAKIAARTVQRMAMQLEELAPIAHPEDRHAAQAYYNSMARRIAVKEEHARICKQELVILWSDFFKKEHLAQFPQLHEIFWNAAKLCSRNKQEISHVAAEELVAAVDEIAKLFCAAKNAPERYAAYQIITDKLF